VPETVDLAFIVLGRKHVLGAVEACAAAGTRAVCIVTAGFAEGDPWGREEQARITAVADEHGIIAIGPNTIGTISMGGRLLGSFVPFPHWEDGNVAIVAQTGIYAGAVALELMSQETQRIGITASVDIGNRVGIDELDLLDPYAATRYFTKIKAMDAHNKAVLNRLGKLLESGSRAQLRSFRNEVRTEYRALKQTQLTSWVKYQKELIAKRDAMLEEHFGLDDKYVKKNMAYEASEYLGEHLDDRFSAKSMSRFLVRHLDRKATEARKLAKGASQKRIEEMTAALYNGGSHNVKRMLAGLIRTLPETEKYMKKVPATRRRLDGVIAGMPLDNQVRTLR